MPQVDRPASEVPVPALADAASQPSATVGWGRAQLLGNAAWLSAGEAVVRVGSLLSFVVVSRVVGPEALGHLTFAIALITYASVLGDGGLTMYTQRELSRGADDPHAAVTATTLVQLTLAAITGLLVLVLVTVLPLHAAVAALVIAQIPLLAGQALNLLYVLQARERMRWVAIVRIVTQATAIVVTVVLVVATGNVVWAAVGTWLGVLAGDAACLAILLALRLFRPVRVTLAALPALASAGVPFLGIAFTTQLFANMDVVVMGMVRPPGEVGEYGAPLRIMQLGFAAMGIVSAAAFPQLAHRFVHDRTAFDALLATLVTVTARWALAATALLVAAADPIVRLLFGEAFAGSGPILAILAFWLPLGFYGTVVGAGLVAAGQQRSYLAGIVTAAGVFVALLAALTPSAGAPGAAVAVIGREVVTFAVLTGLAWRRLDQRRLPLEWVRQGAYLVVPLASCLVVSVAVGAPSLGGLLATWAAACIGLEAALGFPTPRLLSARDRAGE